MAHAKKAKQSVGSMLAEICVAPGLSMAFMRYDSQALCSCDTFGKTWGNGIGPPPTGCSGPDCAQGNPTQAGAGQTDGGSGGDSKTITETPAAAALLGDVALTTVKGSCATCQWAANGIFPIGENIYGPYEAGFGTQQNGILAGLGCGGNPAGSLGHLPGGIDTKTAEAMLAHQCSIQL